jgi:DNA modification methylase
MKLFQGDCIPILQTLPEQSVQCVVTSPPYFGLRDYGVDGQIGLEKIPEEYVNKLVMVFQEVRRVLKDDGTLWLNLGDSYAGGGNYRGINSEETLSEKQRSNRGARGVSQLLGAKNTPNCKPKDLIGIPWMVAFALRADGWYLRSDIIWAKPNPMPESVKDRPTKSHEYIFLLSKNRKYYYDYRAILEPATGYDGRKDTKFRGSKKYKDSGQTFAANGCERWQYKNLQEDGQKPNTMHVNRLMGDEYRSPVRNKRDVWTVSTKPFKGAHFATFPPALIEPCILAGSAEGDTVLDPFCGSGTVGVVCRKYGRDFIGIDLKPEYIKMSRARIEGDENEITRN